VQLAHYRPGVASQGHAPRLRACNTCVVRTAPWRQAHRVQPSCTVTLTKSAFQRGCLWKPAAPFSLERLEELFITQPNSSRLSFVKWGLLIIRCLRAINTGRQSGADRTPCLLGLTSGDHRAWHSLTLQFDLLASTLVDQHQRYS
jgi:hypothetical protein